MPFDETPLDEERPAGSDEAAEQDDVDVSELDQEPDYNPEGPEKDIKGG